MSVFGLASIESEPLTRRPPRRTGRVEVNLTSGVHESRSSTPTDDERKEFTLDQVDLGAALLERADPQTDAERRPLVIDLAEPDDLEDGKKDPETPAQLATKTLSTFVLWLPGEVVAGYAAAVAMMQLPAPAEPVVDVTPWVISLVATPLLLFIVALGKKGAKKFSAPEKRALTARVLLSVPAFVLWSATVPFSAWTVWADTSSPMFWYVMLIAAAVFTAVAEWITAAAKRRRRS